MEDETNTNTTAAEKEIAAKITAMQVSIDALTGKNKELLSEKKAAATKATEAEEKRLQEAGDHEALASSWKEKHNALEATIKEQKANQDAAKANSAMDSAAAKIADAFVDVNFATPMIKSRLATSIDDAGDIHVKALDADGRPSAMTIDELKADIIASANKVLIKGPESTGGNGKGGADTRHGAVPGKTTADMTDDQRKAVYRSRLEQLGYN